MSTIKLIVSDLHLGDGSFPLDCFGERQQDAFAGLLETASSADGPLAQAELVELIINGDCFDFLVTEPYTIERTVDRFIVLQRLEKIIEAHHPFFASLRSFVETSGRSITFITGNHDIELCLSDVRTRICSAITGQPSDARIYFCPARFYRPLPDIYVEHGNYYDFWNHAGEGIWNKEGLPVNSDEAVILPIGSQYFQRVTHQISRRYPYFDHLEPPLSDMRQIALLCLLDPGLVREMARDTMAMLSYTREAHANLAVEEQDDPIRLFEESMLDFAAFRQDALVHKSDWLAEDEEVQQASPYELMEYMTLHDALALPRVEAAASICAPAIDHTGDGVACGMQAVLRSAPTLHYAIAGHTHMRRIEPLDGGAQVYLNTASWTARFVMPSPASFTSTLVTWLAAPDWNNIPLREVTQFVFALIMAKEQGPSSVSLCAWEGGLYGGYRILTEHEE